MSDDEIKTRHMELLQDFRHGTDLASQMILDDLFDCEMTESLAQAVSEVVPDVADFSLYRSSYPDLSEDAVRILYAAAKAEPDEVLEDMNYRARLREVQCDEARINDALAAANALADIEEAVYERKLQRYMAVFNKLSPDDQQKIRQHNNELFGVDMPAVPRGGRDVQLALAAESPNWYLARYRESCAKVLANRGRPFRKVVSVRKSGLVRMSSNGNSAELPSGFSAQVTFTQEPEEPPLEQHEIDAELE